MREQIDEYNEVEAIAKKYTEAVKNGDSKIVKPYFYEQAVFYGQLNDKDYLAGSIQGFYETLDKMGAAESSYISRVDVLSVEPTIAVVRVIEDNWHGYKFTDILVLNKINGDWKIVSKVFDTLPKK